MSTDTLSNPTEIAFADPKLTPTHEDVLAVIGTAAYAPVERVYAWIDSNHHHNVTHEWMYSSSAGWYEIPLIRERRLFYFIPKHGDFRLNILLGNRAVMSLEAGPFAKRVATLLKHAKHYPEGSVFSFDRRTLDPELTIALLRAKLSH